MERRDTGRRDPGDLQHQAEHTLPRRKMSVLGYLAILFAVAFLLLLIAYFQQRRSNLEATDALKESVSAVDTIQAMLEENKRLSKEKEELMARTEQAAQELEEAKQALAQAGEALTQAQADAQSQVDALTQLNQLRALYNQGRYDEGRAMLADREAMTLWRSRLSQISDSLSPDERAIYDPLEAFDLLSGWLLEEQ